MCITGRDVFLISPISPSVTWLVNPGRWMRRDMKCENAASAVRGSRKKRPAVSARMPSVTRTESDARRGWKRFSPLRAVAGAAWNGGSPRGERRHGEQQVQGEEHEEVEIDGEDCGGQQFQERDDRGVEMIAIGLGGEDLHHRQEKYQVDRGRQKLAREQKIIDQIEAGVTER